MNKLIILAITYFLVFCFGCKKESEPESEDDNWTISEFVFTYIIEFNSTNKIWKYSILINDTLSSYYIFYYSDTSLIQKNFNQNSVETRQTIYELDSNNRAVRSYSTSADLCADTIIYSASGFPKKIEYVYLNFSFADNGTDITSESINYSGAAYTPSAILNKVSLPEDFRLAIIPSFTGVFGKENKHLLSSYCLSEAGPGGTTNACRFEYKFDTIGYITEVKKYRSSYYRGEPPPLYGSIHYVKYQYVFE